MKTIWFIQLAGILHGTLLVAGLSMPAAAGLRLDLAKLESFTRRLFWVYYCFIGLVISAFGVLTFLFAESISRGEPVARGLSVLMWLFWTFRLVVAAFVLDLTPFLTTPARRWGNRALHLVFIYLAVIYGWVALKGTLP